MQNFIIGTAGHVDHGKTALIKTLTNIECDTHKEEKKRGITINLGFAHIKHPAGFNIGIVDVPGHKDFINTMIKGSSGINFVLLVIAADSGIMPQTREHLQILNALGIKNGIIVLTKCDLTEPEIIELAKEEISELVNNTFLKNAAICEVSAKNSTGINKLKNEIFSLIDNIKKETVQDTIATPFILNTDRIFSLKGIGTIITGSSVQGKLIGTEPVYLLPNENPKPYKIKSIQKYKDESDTIYPGERAAVNIANIKVDEAAQYTVLSNKPLQSSSQVDAVVNFFNHENKDFTNSSKIKNIQTVRFLLGSLNTQAKLHILFKKNNDTASNHTYFIQAELKNPCVAKYGNRFILRNSSDDKTIGSGMIIDPTPLKHKKKSELLKTQFFNLTENGIQGIIYSELNKNRGITSIDEAALNQNMSAEEIRAGYSQSKDCVLINENIIVNKKIFNKCLKAIPNVLKQYHAKLPLSDTGLTTDAIANILSAQKLNAGSKLVNFLLSELEKESKVKHKSGSWILSSHKPVLSAQLKKNIDLIEQYILDCNMTVPLINELKEYTGKLNVAEKELYQILKHLTGLKKLYFFEDNYIHANIVDSCRIKLIAYLNQNTEKGITVADFRDFIGGNRKICLLLLGIFDKEKTTLRKGDYRYLA